MYSNDLKALCEGLLKLPAGTKVKEARTMYEVDVVHLGQPDRGHMRIEVVIETPPASLAMPK